MTDTGVFYSAFAAALNDELAAIGCRLRVDDTVPDQDGAMLLRDTHGRALGLVPEQADAPSLLAFERILDEQRRSTAGV